MENPLWKTTSVVHSLALAMAKAGDGKTPCLVSFGDVFFKRYLLREIIEYKDYDIVVVCVRENYIKNAYALRTNLPAGQLAEDEALCLVDVLHGDNHPESADTVYFSGLMFIGKPKLVAKLLTGRKTREMAMEDLFRKLLEQGTRIGVVFASTDSIVDVNSARDILMASGLD